MLTFNCFVNIQNRPVLSLQGGNGGRWMGDGQGCVVRGGVWERGPQHAHI